MSVQPAPSTTAEPAPYSLRDLTLYFLRLGTFGFGGPIALVGYMQRDLVETRGWISSKDYKEGLALAQLAPGPLAAQLAIYLGWIRYGVLGATSVDGSWADILRDSQSDLLRAFGKCLPSRDVRLV